MTDYKVVVSSSMVKMKADEAGVLVGPIWLGDVDMVLFMVGVE